MECGASESLKLSLLTRMLRAGALCASASCAMAQSPSADASASDRLQLESVTVTGKRLQRPSEAIGNVTSIDGSWFEGVGARGQEDIWWRVPGIQPNGGRPNQALPTFRGIGTTTASDLLGAQQATTGFYIEDVPFTDPFGFVGNADLAPFDLEGIDILRGPQGVLYGSASLGGAINLRLRRPDLGAFGHAVLGRVAVVRDGAPERAAYAMVNAPLVAGVAGVRAVAYERHDGGTIDNLGTGRPDANRLRQRGGRIVGELRPSPDLALRALLLSQRTENADAMSVEPDPSRWERRSPTASSRANEFGLAKLQVDAALPAGLALTAISAALDKRAAYTSDTTAAFGRLGSVYGPLLGIGPLPDLPGVVSRSLRPLRSRAVSHELRVATAGDAPLRTIVGMLDQRTHFDWQGVTVAPGGAALWGPAGFLLPQDVLNETEVGAHTRESAVFADLEWHAPGGIVAGLGGRSFRTRAAFRSAYTFLGRGADVAAGTVERGFTPRASLRVRRGGQEAYALVSRGFRFGGVNLDAPRLTPYRSDAVWNREIGLRLATGPSSRIALTAFEMDWRDAQVSTLLPGPPPTSGVANVGRARSRGFELQWNWQPAAAFDLRAAVAHTDARTTAAFGTAAGAAVPAGTALPGTPRWHASVEAAVNFAGPAGAAGTLTVAQTAMGARTYDLEGRGRAPGFGVLDVGVRLARAGWETRLGVDNVLDTVAVVGAAPVAVPGGASFVEWFRARGRTVSLTLRHDL
jgi:iron complex outermembrane receptor protein